MLGPWLKKQHIPRCKPWINRPLLATLTPLHPSEASCFPSLSLPFFTNHSHWRPSSSLFQEGFMWFIYSLGLLSGNEAASCLVVVNFNYWQKPQLEVAAAVALWYLIASPVHHHVSVAHSSLGCRAKAPTCTSYDWLWNRSDNYCAALHQSKSCRVSRFCTYLWWGSAGSVNFAYQSFITVTFQERTRPEYLADLSGVF